MDHWLSWGADRRVWLSVLVVAIVLIFIWLTRPRVSYGWKPPLSKREQAFYRRLQNLAASEGLVLLSQVAFSQFLLVMGEGKARNREWFRWRQKVADFVVCDRDFNIVAVIELDDASHIGKEDQDAERDRVLNAAGIRTLRFASMPADADLLLTVQGLARDAVGRPSNGGRELGGGRQD